MNKQYKERFTHFEGTPVVDVVGILKDRRWGWSPTERSSPPQPEDLGFTYLVFEAWRVADGEIHLTRLHVSALLSYQQWNSLASPFNQPAYSPIVCIKARFAQHPNGFQEVLLEEWIGPAPYDAELDRIYRELSRTIEIDSPPLPHLQLLENTWYGTISLPMWKDFYLKSGYMEAGRTEYQLRISSEEAPPVRLGYKGVPPTPEQVAAYTYLIENEKAVQEAVLQAMLDNYEQWQENYGLDEETMPEVTSTEQFQSLVILWTVGINLEAKDGFAYVYLELLPEWDIEHGMGAILHKNRVVSASDHDSLWNAIEQDLKE